MLRGLTLDILKLAGFSLIVTAASVIAMGLLRATLPWPEPGMYVTIFFVHALVIGALCWQVMPRLGAWSENRPWALRWTILLGALLGLAIAGTALASIAIHYTYSSVGGVPPPIFFGVALSTAIPVTIVVGVIATLIVAGRDRLELSQAVLQEQRLRRETAEKLAAEARLASLASRVQPHFLFNTLNSIAALIRENPGEAEQTVERLASLLRTSLDSTETVALDQEITLVRDYLEIQKTRMGERLTFNFSMEPGVHAAIPPFSVQTLVENSLKHVAQQLQQAVDVRIRANRRGGDVMVFVTDDGPGFDSNFMKAGHGLDNLQGRLRAVYGDRAGLEFVRKPGQMTVGLRVPGE